MNRMAYIIIGIILLVIGYLLILRAFDKSTNHYVVEINLYKAELEYNNQVARTLIFSTADNEPLTTNLIKEYFGYKSNDKVVITDIRSITKEEKYNLLKLKQP